MSTRSELETLTRDGLIERARRLGVPRPEVMTRVEMMDEIIRRQETDVTARRRARGWLGVARDLVASLIEQGLNMPDTAELVRQGGLTTTRVAHQPPVATVTLAEIYAAQGHLKRALGMLDEVLEKEPDHSAARALRDRLGRDTPRPVAARPVEAEQPEGERATEAEPEAEPEPVSAVEPESEPVSAVEPEPEAVAVVAPVEPEPEAVAVAPVEPEPEAVAPVPAAVESMPAAVAPVPAAVAPVPAAVAPVAAVKPSPPPTSAEAPAPVAAHEPPRSDVLVLISDAEGAFVFWELSNKSRAAATGPERRFVVRLCAVAPGVAGARKSQRDVPLADPSGSLLVRGLGSDAVVRGALGYESAGVFSPLVVASVVSPDSDPGSALVFSPLGGERVDGRTVERARSEHARAAP